VVQDKIILVLVQLLEQEILHQLVQLKVLMEVQHQDQVYLAVQVEEDL